MLTTTRPLLFFCQLLLSLSMMGQRPIYKQNQTHSYYKRVKTKRSPNPFFTSPITKDKDILHVEHTCRQWRLRIFWNQEKMTPMPPPAACRTKNHWPLSQSDLSACMCLLLFIAVVLENLVFTPPYVKSREKL